MPDDVRGKELIGKTIVSEEKGKKFGEVADLSYVADTGELMNLLLTNTTKNVKEVNLDEDEKGRLSIPFSAVKSVGDFVIVSEDDIV